MSQNTVIRDLTVEMEKVFDDAVFVGLQDPHPVFVWMEQHPYEPEPTPWYTIAWWRLTGRIDSFRWWLAQKIVGVDIQPIQDDWDD